MDVRFSKLAAGLATAIAALALGLTATTLRAQGDDERAERRQEMRRLDWMVGDWQGAGWIDRLDQGRQEFSLTQTVRSEFDGLVLLIEGEGLSRQDGSRIYRSLRSVSRYPGFEHFAWHEYSPDGTLRSNEAIARGDSLELGLPPSRSECAWVEDAEYQRVCPTESWIRRRIRQTADGEWVEIGELRHLPGRGEWFQFLEIVLARTGP